MITLANRMRNNGKLGQYNIRERTKVIFILILYYVFALVEGCVGVTSDIFEGSMVALGSLSCRWNSNS